MINNKIIISIFTVLFTVSMAGIMPTIAIAADLGDLGDDYVGGGGYVTDYYDTDYDTSSYVTDYYDTDYDTSSYVTDYYDTDYDTSSYVTDYYDTDYDTSSYVTDYYDTDYDTSSYVTDYYDTDYDTSSYVTDYYDTAYNTPSFSRPTSNYSFPNISSFIPSSRSYASAAPRQSQTQNVYNYGSRGGSSSYPVYIPTPTYPAPGPAPQQPIYIPTPAPAPVAAAPINIVNNNVNNNVNTNTAPAPVAYQPPVYVPPIVVPQAPVAPQCAIYATASANQGGRVTLSWATDLGDTTEVYCTNSALGNKRVAPIDTEIIYPWASTTCYAVVKKSTTGASKTCSVYVPVEKAQPTYIPPVVTPTYTPPVVVQQPVYVPPTPTYVAPEPTYVAPVVTLASAVIPTYEERSIVLSETPYTGFDDPIWMFTYIALMVSAGYAFYAYYPALRGRRQKFSVVNNY